jgi:hypothetical protein
MDDTHTMFVSLSWRVLPTSMRPLKNGQMVPGSRFGFDYLPNTADWYGRWRLTQNPSNDWMIDRQAQKTESYTGLPASTARTRRNIGVPTGSSLSRVLCLLGSPDPARGGERAEPQGR